MKIVKIHLLGDSPVLASMRQVAKLINGVEFVTTASEAQIMIAENFHAIETVYSPDKHFVLVSLNNYQTAPPESVHIYHPTTAVPKFFALIEKVRETLNNEEVPEELIPEVALLPDAKKILVIDDTPANLVSAKKCLAEHHLTVAKGYEMAMTLLSEEEFDIVLTDLYLPMSSKTLSEEAFKLGKLVPYGFILMLEATRRGAKFVAIVTDLNHHADHFSAAFDHFGRFSLAIEGAKVQMLHARVEDGAKDWTHAMEILLRED